MTTIGRKNLKEQAAEPVPVEENTKNEATEEKEIVEEPKTIETEESEIIEAEEIEPIEIGKQKTKKVLKAITHILYNGRIYEPQEELPVDNTEMIEAWTDAGTAIWD